MFPYIETVAQIMVPLLSFIFAEEVRIAAAALMPELVKSAVRSLQSGLCPPEFVSNLVNFIMERLVKVRYPSVCLHLNRDRNHCNLHSWETFLLAHKQSECCSPHV